MRLLWITSNLPSFDGLGTQRSDSAQSLFSLLRETAAHGHGVDLVIFLAQRELAQREALLKQLSSEFSCSAIFLIPCERGFGPHFLRPLLTLYHSLKNPKLPLAALPFYGERAHDAVTALLNGRLRRLKELGVQGSFDGFQPGWDGVVYDSPFLAAHMFDGVRIIPPEGFPPIFYRPLLPLGDLYREIAREERGGVKKNFAVTQAELIKEFELAFLRKVKMSLPLSPAQQARFKEILPRLEQVVLPFPYALPKEEEEGVTRDENTFLLYADVYQKSARFGCEWFLKEVWPEVLERRPEVKLKLLGEEPKLKRFIKGEEISVVQRDREENFLQAFSSAAAFLLPQKFGEPPRALMLKSLSSGCSIIGSESVSAWLAHSAERGVFRCETESAWISSLTNIPFEALITAGKQGRELLKEEHEPGRVGEGFLKVIEEALKPEEPAERE